MKDKIKIVLADDNKDFCQVLKEYLSNEEDIEILGIAKDGVEALQLVQEKQPDLLVLDVIMPHLDGLGVIEKLNAMNLEKMPKIIVLSAVGQDKITQTAINLGADYYIVKPFDFVIFINRIRELVLNKPVSPQVKTKPVAELQMMRTNEALSVVVKRARYTINDEGKIILTVNCTYNATLGKKQEMLADFFSSN